MKRIKIEDRQIGDGCPPYVVAEVSANHNGSIDNVLNIIKRAAECGVDAVKIQSYEAENMTIDVKHPNYLISEGMWSDRYLFDLYKCAQTPFDWHKDVFAHAKKLGITCFSTPFDESAVDVLEDLNAPAYKIASFELTDIPLVKYAASTNKPLIISTGMSDAEEIEETVASARDAGCTELILLHCLSAYPAPSDQFNMRTLPDLRDRFDVLVGLSDHTLDNTSASVALALDACLIEKHFTSDRNIDSPDSKFSLEPREMKSLVGLSKEIHQILGMVSYERKECEKQNIRFRRSLNFVKALSAGDTITSDDVRRIRPGFGLPPKYYENVIGCTVKRNVERGDPVTSDVLVETIGV